MRISDWSSDVCSSDLVFAQLEGQMGLCQWFHFEEPRLADAVNWLRRLGVRKLRTGLSWADWFRPGALEWFDRQLEALQEFDVTLTSCFPPAHRSQHGRASCRERVGR